MESKESQIQRIKLHIEYQQQVYRSCCSHIFKKKKNVEPINVDNVLLCEYFHIQINLNSKKKLSHQLHLKRKCHNTYMFTAVFNVVKYLRNWGWHFALCNPMLMYTFSKFNFICLNTSWPWTWYKKLVCLPAESNTSVICAYIYIEKPQLLCSWPCSCILY